MRNLLNFLARYNNLIIFLLLEGIAVYLVVTRNDYQNSRFLKSVRVLTIGVEKKITATRNYLNLREINAKIALENIGLRNSIQKLTKQDNNLFFAVSDTVNQQQYTYTSATIVNNSTNRQKNFFTIGKGTKQGIETDMAVSGPDGVAGIVVSCSDNFSIAMSLLNLDFRLSVRMKYNGYFGSPQHVIVYKGDTVQTTGYSAIFPEGVFVGIVDDFEKSGGDFYKIRILLATDFRKLNYVNVIGNLRKKEQLEIEKGFQ
jgi:rod shape-determining protein MreC